jgi:hypothetical protein
VLPRQVTYWWYLCSAVVPNGIDTMRTVLFLSFAVVFHWTCALSQPVSPQAPLIGRWIYVGENRCIDTYAFRPDGTFSSTSGAEALEGSFTIDAPSPMAGARYKVVRTIKRGNDRPDCSGYTSASVGKSDTRYVAFSPRLDQMVVCPSASASECFGPLTRVSP